MDNSTRQEIDKSVLMTLRDAGLIKPPILVEDLLHSLEVNRSFYDLEDPTLIQRFLHKVRVGGQKLNKMNLLGSNG